MSRKEVPRAGLVKTALVGRITNAQGATALRLTVRQFQRLKARVRVEGAGGLLHRARGQPSKRRLPVEVCDQVATLLQTTYQGFNDSHFTDKLQATDDPRLHLSRSTVRRIRRALGLPPKHRRRRSTARHRRVPEAAMGALIQVDASPFDWLEEDLHGYAVVFQQVFTTYGLPLAVYGDGINILVHNDAHWTLEEELAGVEAPMHLGRVLQDLGQLG